MGYHPNLDPELAAGLDRLGAPFDELSAYRYDELPAQREGWLEPSPYAAPARAIGLTGLPPTYLCVGELEVFRDECVAYALRLLQAGVPTELHVHPGAFHGWEIFPDAEISRRSVAERTAALRRALR